MRVVVIGGGFSGAIFAIHLMRDHPQLRCALEIIEPRAMLGTGLAYSTPDPLHLTNVPARAMSPFIEDEGHFERWVSDRVDMREADGSIFPPRATFGRYIASLLRTEAARGCIRFRHRRTRALAVGNGVNGRLRVELDNGGETQADVLILATGHRPSDLPRAVLSLRGDPALISDPWHLESLTGCPGPVAIIGSGLTACDTLATLRRTGYAGEVTMISRHGLLPRGRRPGPVKTFGDFDRLGLRVASQVMRRVRRTIAEAEETGHAWQHVIAALRQQATQLWRDLTFEDKNRLLRHLRSYWDVHRFQAAPAIERLFNEELAAGRLHVIAAKITSAAQASNAILLRLRPRGGTKTVDLPAATVINCTGPAPYFEENNPFIRSLHQSCGVVTDPFGFGFAVDNRSQALDQHGEPIPGIFAVGPPARSAFGEMTGLPQVAAQPRAVAQQIADLIRGSQDTRENDATRRPSR